jgi:hypothetical protein
MSMKDLRKNRIQGGQLDKEYTVGFHQVGIGRQNGKNILGEFIHIVRCQNRQKGIKRRGFCNFIQLTHYILFCLFDILCKGEHGFRVNGRAQGMQSMQYGRGEFIRILF